ncbi:Phospho-N-acetylmuramoyl-pentapeptide-transferase [Candidatus Cyrtobacter comes]|uniref:Phospho-N-acetylmuramoyl-pentapeptide-transferase n=1 Tax=Candidatus Cyrtobacter comes TaxID=675776 RepID=A0ABU5L7U5_9RICK|nr:phospho-N-acetylmuramoyl-pentapeptide-transferase [Candidatus Cyrtobacter comes]MDZ5762197.1 Phospho-N-acetylmuramoyl-pentapeptide-transferase [Candidatus Cyrtobacter comes]
MLFPKTIRYLAKIQLGGQPIREDGPKSHIKKSGTPTMGGLLIIASIMLSSLIWVDLANMYILVAIFVTLSMGVLGFIDDYKKIKYKNSKGVSAKWKLVWQVSTTICAAIAIILLTQDSLEGAMIFIPFICPNGIDIGIFLYLIFAFFVITGSCNAVNLTDGLDGLVTVPIISTTACLAVISYITSNVLFSDYLKIQYIPGTEELFIYCGSIIGASIAFLWYNANPAKVFMGDVGSLALGGALGVMALIMRQEFIFGIAGAVFVLEAVSVIIQVVYYKRTKKRFFKMAPIHHHFEQMGYSENLIVVRFWILSFISCAVAIMVLRIGY